MKKLNGIWMVPLLAAACWSEQIMLGGVGPNVMPLLGPTGLVLQWNAPTMAGGIFPGSSPSNPCGALLHCYGFNGTVWQFNMTGSHFCKNTCTFNATGPLKMTVKKLPGGSQTFRVSATLHGTFVDQNGIEHENVLGFFNSFTSPATDDVKELAAGGLVIVLKVN